MTPDQLSLTIVDALEALVAEGSVTLPDGVPTTVTVERPRQKGHGDYATNVALQLAKQAGTNPRAFAELVAASWPRPTASPPSRSPGPASSTSPSTPAPRGRSPPTSSPRGRRTAPPTRSPARRSTSSSSPPTRPARCTSAASAGPPSATRSAGSSTLTGAEVTREYYFNDHGAQIDRFGASLHGRRAGPAGARGRLRRRLHRRDRQGRRGQAPRRPRRCPRPRRRRSSAPRASS